jgi:hypothetical protein
LAVTGPEDYLAALPDDTLVKIEVDAIGAEDNATFSELSDVCVNETDEGGLLSVSAYYFQGLESDEDEGCGEEDE